MPVKHADEKRKKALKILLFGDSSSGKTHLALQSTPGAILMFDAESGSDFFEGRKGFDFDYWLDDDGLKTASIRELNKAIDYLETEEGRKKYKTFIVDPISDIWDNIQAQRLEYKEERLAKRGTNLEDRNEAELESFNVKDWGDMKRIYKNLMLRMKNLPQNIILIAREKEISETKANGELVRTGEYTFDAEKNTRYAVDFAIRLVYEEKNKKRWAQVSKSRGDGLERGEKIDNPTFAVFDKVVNSMADGKEVKGISTKPENVFVDEEKVGWYKDKIVEFIRESGDKKEEYLAYVNSKYGTKNPNKIDNLDDLKNLYEYLTSSK